MLIAITVQDGYCTEVGTEYEAEAFLRDYQAHHTGQSASFCVTRTDFEDTIEEMMDARLHLSDYAIDTTEPQPIALASFSDIF